MKRVVAVWNIGIVGLLSFMPLQSFAVGSPSLVIREVYLGSPIDATDEYVVIHNNSNDVVDLQGVELEYKSATGKSWTRKAFVADPLSLSGHSDALFATKRDRQVAMSDGLAQAGGNLHVTVNGAVIDRLAWGTGDSPEGVSISAPKAGIALERECSDDDGVCVDSDNNSQDFSEKLVDASASQGNVPVNNPTGTGQPGKGSVDSVVIEDYAIEITELLPDPTSPQTDAKDEFIEIYNAGSGTATLTGWKLSDGKHSFSLDSVNLGAGEYRALYSRDTKLSLNNDGDQILLLRPSGETEFITPNYGKAKTATSFGATETGWGWLESASPGSVNAGLSLDQSPSKAKTSTSSKSKGGVKKSSAKSASAAKTGKLADGGVQSETNSDASAEDRPGVPWSWILAGLGSLTVGYGAYEYRPEILSFFTKLRAKLGAGK
ncbi:lamin tail domain-containing protein [bacterium]|nr:lamin tail domain-containing protein [bacterium]